jgi:hypothetical protein
VFGDDEGGEGLADLHVNYESAKQFLLKRQENQAVKLDWRVETMKLSTVGRAYSRAGSGASKQRGDGSPVASPHHDLLTLSGIPAGRSSVLASPNPSAETERAGLVRSLAFPNRSH